MADYAIKFDHVAVARQLNQICLKLVLKKFPAMVFMYLGLYLFIYVAPHH